jgi:hypothetical protein
MNVFKHFPNMYEPWRERDAPFCSLLAVLEQSDVSMGKSRQNLEIFLSLRSEVSQVPTKCFPLVTLGCEDNEKDETCHEGASAKGVMAQVAGIKVNKKI